jgi:hypothetical protein
MLRRFNSVKRMTATVAAATVIGLIIEAGGLSIWAQRLEVGVLRDIASPITQVWEQAISGLHLDAPRRWALIAKASLADVMMPEPITEQVVDTALTATENNTTTVAAQIKTNTIKTNTIKTSKRSGRKTKGEVTLPVAVNFSGNEKIQIALVGDSMMAVGLAPVLRRALAKEDNVNVIRAYRSGTGLGRPDVFNWMEEYPKMRGIKKPHIVICAIGANDAQGFQIDRTVYAFGTTQWNAVYAERARNFLNLLGQDGARIIWLGMPVMREPNFSKRMMTVSALTKSVVTEYPQVTWLDPNLFLNDAGTSFTQFRFNQKGQMIRLRGDDGIHLSDDGAAFLVPAILSWIQAQQKIAVHKSN